MGIGQNIRNLRTDAGMSQEELAERLDPPYTRPAVTAWESGRAKPRMDTVVQIAELFGVSVADLMGHGGVEPRRSSRRVPVRLMGSAHAGEWSEAVPDDVVAVIPEEAAGRVGDLLGPPPRTSPEDVARHGDVPAGGDG